MSNLQYLITGTGRCGTVFVSRYLTSMGIPCGHESVFNIDGIDNIKNRFFKLSSPHSSFASKNSLIDGKWIKEDKWIDDENSIVADSSYIAAPYLNEDFLKDTKIIHVVRDPMKVISSFCNDLKYFHSHTPQNEYEQFIYEQLPDLKSNSLNKYERTTLYVILWNRMIQKSTVSLFFRIEDEKNKLCDFFGIKENESSFKNEKINTFRNRNSQQFGLKDIKSNELTNELLVLIKEFGYKPPMRFIF